MLQFNGLAARISQQKKRMRRRHAKMGRSGVRQPFFGVSISVFGLVSCLLKLVRVRTAYNSQFVQQLKLLAMQAHTLYS